MVADEFKNTYKIADQIRRNIYFIILSKKSIFIFTIVRLFFDEHKISLMRLLNPMASNYGLKEIKGFNNL
jgi:hypothetical protein